MKDGVVITVREVERKLTNILQSLDPFVTPNRVGAVIRLFIAGRFAVTVAMIRLLDSYRLTPTSRYAVIEVLMDLAQEYEDVYPHLDIVGAVYSTINKSITIPPHHTTHSFQTWLESDIAPDYTPTTDVDKLIEEYAFYVNRTQGS